MISVKRMLASFILDSYREITFSGNGNHHKTLNGFKDPLLSSAFSSPSLLAPEVLGVVGIIG
jgi:hypothetical protein